MAIPLLGDLGGLGDMAVAAEIARQWAWTAVRDPRLGLAESADVVECLTGYWLGTLHPRATERRASRNLQHPGRPHPLNRLRALERGFTDGFEACRRMR